MFEFLSGPIGGWLFLLLFVIVFIANKKFCLLFCWVFVAWGLVMIPSVMNLRLFGDMIPIGFFGIENYINLYTIVSIFALLLTVSFIKSFFGTNNKTFWISFFISFIFAGWIIFSHEDLYYNFVSILGGSEWIMIVIFDIVLLVVPIYFVIHWMRHNPVTRETVMEAVKEIPKRCIKFTPSGECELRSD